MKLTSKLPDDVDNGLDVIYGALCRHPERQHLVVALVDCCRLTTETDTGDVEPTARITHVEVIRDKEAAAYIQGALTAARARRTGQEVLPLGVDPVTGEISGAA